MKFMSIIMYKITFKVFLHETKRLVGSTLFAFNDWQCITSMYYFPKCKWIYFICFQDMHLQTSLFTERGQHYRYQKCTDFCLPCEGFSQWKSYEPMLSGYICVQMWYNFLFYLMLFVDIWEQKGSIHSALPNSIKHLYRNLQIP